MTPLIFIKFGEKIHIDALLQKGEVYMTPLLDFKKKSNNKQRYDKYEGNLSNHYSTNGTIQIKPTNESIWKNLHYTEAHFNKTISDKSLLSYSLYVINKEDFFDGNILSIDQRMKEFGTDLLIIRNTSEFIRRVTNYFSENNLEYAFDHVKYYDEKTNHDSLSLFHKPIEFSHQKEFRILSKSSSIAPIKFSIGKIEEFAESYSAENLASFRFKLQSG